jgi:LPXTG-site transpeptidase (sortase) family protein
MTQSDVVRSSGIVAPAASILPRRWSAEVPEPPGPLGRPMRIALPAAVAVMVVLMGALTPVSETPAEPASTPVPLPAAPAHALQEPAADSTWAAPSLIPVLRPAAVSARVRPLRIVISRVGVDAPVRAVGLMASGEIEVPPLSPRNLAGWYKYGPVPGETGPAVIVGHKSTRSGPSVFDRAAELRRGDAIEILRSDGRVVVFTVDRIDQVRKTEFPTERVYGNIGRPGLRLITCAGDFNRRTGTHTGNLIVYASLRPVGSV